MMYASSTFADADYYPLSLARTSHGLRRVPVLPLTYVLQGNLGHLNETTSYLRLQPIPGYHYHQGTVQVVPVDHHLPLRYTSEVQAG